jgi:hypothetical protein
MDLLVPWQFETRHFLKSSAPAEPAERFGQLAFTGVFYKADQQTLLYSINRKLYGAIFNQRS